MCRIAYLDSHARATVRLFSISFAALSPPPETHSPPDLRYCPVVVASVVVAVVVATFVVVVVAVAVEERPGWGSLFDVRSVRSPLLWNQLRSPLVHLAEAVAYPPLRWEVVS